MFVAWYGSDHPAFLDQFVEASFCSRGGYAGGGRSLGSLSSVQVKKEGEGIVGRGRRWVGTWGVGTGHGDERAWEAWEHGIWGLLGLTAQSGLVAACPLPFLYRGGQGFTFFRRPLDRTSGQPAAH